MRRPCPLLSAALLLSFVPAARADAPRRDHDITLDDYFTLAALSDRFAGRSDGPEPRFLVVNDTPLVDGAIAHFVARVEKSYWGGDHSLFLGRVEYARQNPGTPLLFHGGRYEKLGA